MTTVETNFKPAFDIGHKAELKVLEHCKQIDPDSRLIEGKFKDYDLIMPNRHITVEIKKDVMAKDTGNYAIEFRCNGNPSGISATKALYWVIVDEGQMLWFLTGSLKNFLKANWKYLKKVKGGDDNSSEMILVKKEDLKNLETWLI